MARIRSIKPEFWVSEQIAECSTNARLTFIGLWNFADDNGVHPAKPKTLKAELYPMDDVTSGQVSEWVDELIRVGLLAEFESAGARYWHITGWSRHQKIDRPSLKYPAPPSDGNSPPSRRGLDEGSTNARRAPPPGEDRSGEDRSGEEGRSPKARPTPKRAPTKTRMPDGFTVSDRVKAWAAEKGFGDAAELELHLEAFRGKATAKGYTYADWDAAFMEAIRQDWAKLRAVSHANGSLPAGGELDCDHDFRSAR